jgi:hypothetical protein
LHIDATPLATTTLVVPDDDEVLLQNSKNQNGARSV